MPALVSGGKREREHRIVLAEDLRQHRLRPIGRELHRIASFVLGDLFQVGQRHRDLVLGFDQQIVFGEEAGEQRPMPVLVFDLANQPACLNRSIGRHDVAERARVRAQPVAHVYVRLDQARAARVFDTKRRQGLSCPFFR